MQRGLSGFVMIPEALFRLTWLYSPLDLGVSFHVDSGYPLYRIVTLLPEPLTVILAVYGESESSGAVLVGAELQNSVLSVERSLKLGRGQFARKFVWAQGKQGFRPFQIPQGTKYVGRHRVEIEIQLTTTAAIFDGFSFGRVPQPGSDKSLYRGICALAVHGHTHENRGFALLVEFCPADVKQQAECRPFHRHLILGCKDTIPSVLYQEVKL